MNWSPAHLHLLVNHLPILGAPFVLLVLAWGAFTRSRDVTRLALWLMVPLALVGFLADQSGDSAKHQLKAESWIDKALVHEHEERADTTVIVFYVVGALGALALWRRRSHPDERWPLGVAAVALTTASLLAAWTGLAGGVIRHDEIRPAAAAPAATSVSFRTD
ncbi:MAG: hypothetical protein WBC97_10735 [Gemmatimonadales bacterium]